MRRFSSIISTGMCLVSIDSSLWADFKILMIECDLRRFLAGNSNFGFLQCKNGHFLNLRINWCYYQEYIRGEELATVSALHSERLVHARGHESIDDNSISLFADLRHVSPGPFLHCKNTKFEFPAKKRRISHSIISILKSAHRDESIGTKHIPVNIILENRLIRP